MNDILSLAIALIAGVGFGGFFFGGLWWTVRHAMASTRSVIWLSVSLLLRMAITLIGFHFVTNGHWQRLLACVLGFLMARTLVMYFTRSTIVSLTQPVEKSNRAT
ncbi:ATP synthase subunit I [Undibacterium sp. RTI2.1]|uniref:ATP synthase subunit I n=1 Tax=unclassified Undibacterium TaxID=2630295 RepID=UPI002B23C59B|nr:MULTISPECIES: ATP synthase subunit I [unclassified Undibacterium]MEB0032153.1 ATP synthase subunit I [Undibacterium sp. RTI2.1]MEB0118317.1 ATP synthase subunit I [Undibacterium sp. RTI2.2]